MRKSIEGNRTNWNERELIEKEENKKCIKACSSISQIKEDTQV